MSVILPLMDDIPSRVRKEIVEILQVFYVLQCYISCFLHPIYAFIGVIGGIGVRFSTKYGWQAVFNTFGALAIATELYGLRVQ